MLLSSEAAILQHHLKTNKKWGRSNPDYQLYGEKSTGLGLSLTTDGTHHKKSHFNNTGDSGETRVQSERQGNAQKD